MNGGGAGRALPSLCLGKGRAGLKDLEWANFWLCTFCRGSLWAVMPSVPWVLAEEGFLAGPAMIDEGGAGGTKEGLCSLNAIHMTL